MQLELRASPEDRRVAALAAAAIGLTLVEAAIPLPIPGIKPGLANIVTLVVLYRYGWRTAAWVAGLRIVAGALALGQFLTPAFVMSLSGGVTSLLLLALAIRLPTRWFGPIGLSVLAAFAHIGAQLLVVDAWLLPGASILGLMPLFLTAAWVTGLVNGLAAAHLLSQARGLGKT
ncbi:MAG: Gx transporter family protein [Gallionellaceae bacterium]|nr:Gx transporter family protein [Gallionellaceae bacterium]